MTYQRSPSTERTPLQNRWSDKRTVWIALGILLLLAAVVRWFYYLEIKDTTLFTVPQLDCLYYHDWARKLAGGDWGRGQPYWMGPLYPHFLALVYIVFGIGMVAPAIIQWAITLLCIWLVFAIGRRLCGSAIALTAAGLYALYAPPVFYAGFLLMASVLTLLFLLCLLQLLQTLDRPTARHALLLGALIGLTGLARGNNLLLILAVPFLFGSTLPRLRQRVTLTAALFLGCLAVLLPVTLRNVIVGGDAVLLTSNGGFNLYIGQQTEYLGTFGHQEIVLDLQVDPNGEIRLEQELGRDVKPSEVSRTYTARAVREFVSQPLQMIVHYARKAYRFWSGYELPQVVSFVTQRSESTALRLLFVPYTLLAALGLLGLWRLRRMPQRAVPVFIAVTFLSLLPFFPTARYRMPIAPLLAISSAAFIAAVLDDFRRRQNRAGWLKLAAAAGLIVILLPRWSALDASQVAWQHHIDAAYRALAMQDDRAALESVRKADRALPDYAGTYYRLGFILEEFGDDQKALAAYRHAEELAPGEHVLPYKTGRTLHRLGRMDEALAAFERSARLDSTWGQPYFGMAMVQRDRGDTAAAIAAMEKAAAIDPGVAHHRNNLASLYAETGRQDLALQTLEQLLAAFPGYAKGWINLALLQSQMQQPQAARTSLAKAARLPDLALEEKANIQGLLNMLNREVPP